MHRHAVPAAHAVRHGVVVSPDPRLLDKPPPTILVLDDEDAVRRVIARALTAHGFHVLSAHDADTAMDVARTHPGAIHLLLSDLMLAASSGATAALRIAAIRPGLRTLFMSGREPDEGPSDGSMHGPLTEFLHKPFSTADLVASVNAALLPAAGQSAG